MPIAFPTVSALPKLPRYQPELHVSNNTVAQALDHLQALRKIYAQMRANELNKIKTGVIVVKRLPYAGKNSMRRGSSKFSSLLD